MAIRSDNGRSSSTLSLEELEGLLEGDICRLSPDERETFRIMVAEMALGTVDPGQRIYDVLGDALYKRPLVDIETFVKDPYYLGNTCDNLYPVLLADLEELFDGDYTEAIWTGGIGTGKTFVASIGVCRVLYELSCMRNPQQAFSLAAGSMLAVVCISVNETLAKKVVFENVGSKIQASPYFQEHFPFQKTQKEMRFPEHVWLVARATTDNSILGLNTISALMDEGNFMYRTDGKQALDGSRYGVVDQATTLYAGMKRRMKSRFQRGGKLPAKLFIVSSKQTHNDFTAKLIAASAADPHVFVRDYALWDTKPAAHFSPERFWVLVGNEHIPSRILDPGEEIPFRQPGGMPDSCCLVDVPEDFRADFERDLEESIRDLAGIATTAVNPFIQRRSAILGAVDESRAHPFSVLVYDPSKPAQFMWDALVEKRRERQPDGSFEEAFRPRLDPKAVRHVHIDPSLRRDATGFCMSHISGRKSVLRTAEDGKQFWEDAPVYCVDLVLRIVPPIGGEIVLGELRHLVYSLSAHGFLITKVSLDSWQSTDTIQQLGRKGYSAEVVSVDTTPEPYDNLKAALYEGRVQLYPYPPLTRELEHLQEERRGNRRRIDHPNGGSKDCADAVAGCFFTLSKRIDPPAVAFLQGGSAHAPWEPGAPSAEEVDYPGGYSFPLPFLGGR